MKKNKIQDQFFLELEKVPITQVACEKAGVSRNSVYRWRKEDKTFSKKMDESIARGVALVNDMSESQLLTLIKEKSYSAISFWLRHRNDNYKERIEVVTKEDNEALSPAQAKIVRNALKLAAITKSKSIKKIQNEENN